MSQPEFIASRGHPCFRCRLTFETFLGRARHMQATHPNKSRLAGATTSGAASVEHQPLAGLYATQGPQPLNLDASMGESLPEATPPLGSAALNVGTSSTAVPARRPEGVEELQGADFPGLVSDSDDDAPDLMSDSESDGEDSTSGFENDNDGDASLQARGRAQLRAAVHAAR